MCVCVCCYSGAVYGTYEAVRYKVYESGLYYCRLGFLLVLVFCITIEVCLCVFNVIMIVSNMFASFSMEHERLKNFSMLCFFLFLRLRIWFFPMILPYKIVQFNQYADIFMMLNVLLSILANSVFNGLFLNLQFIAQNL